MTKNLKMSVLAVICSVGIAGISVAGIQTPKKSEKTLVDYLNGENVSFLLIKSDENAKLTTYGWVDANKSCKIIRSAGFSVSNIRNYAAESRAETSASCKN